MGQSEFDSPTNHTYTWSNAMQANRDSNEYPCQNISKLVSRCTSLVRRGAIILHGSFHTDSGLQAVKAQYGSVRTCHSYICSNGVAMDSKDSASKFVSQQVSRSSILVRWGHHCPAQVIPYGLQVLAAKALNGSV